MKRFFDAELQSLHADIVRMGELARESVRGATRALLDGDLDAARDVCHLDETIDKMEVRIDADCARYITMRAPVASDVRLLVAAMKINRELERVGDEATTIARIARRLRLNGGGSAPTGYFALPKMAKTVDALQRDALEAFVCDDGARAQSLPSRDKEVDILNRENYARITAEGSERGLSAAQIVDLLFASKSYERIGDHAVNLAEEIVFLITGEDVRHAAPAAQLPPSNL